MKEVTLDIRFPELFGEQKSDIADDIKRQRWEEWKAMAIAAGSAELVKFWTDTSACQGCKHLNADWCKLQSLPITVNSLLTFYGHMVGMACGGAGYEIEEKQLDLF